ncbi:MAG: hypothetical protein R8L58_01765, partial [Mariprofundaceae bacterium]
MSRKKKTSPARKNVWPDKPAKQQADKSTNNRPSGKASDAAPAARQDRKPGRRPARDPNREDDHSAGSPPAQRRGRGKQGGEGRPTRGGKRPSRHGDRKQGRRGGKEADQQTWVGRVSAHPDGFGFVDVQGLEKGIFLPHEEMRDLMHGDTVEVRSVRRRGRESGEVVRVVEHAPSILVGEFKNQSGVGLVQPRSRKMPQNITVASRDSKNAVDGDWVRVEIKRGSR